MEIRFLGAAREVTGSCFHLLGGGTEILVDCGMRQGGKKDNHEGDSAFSFNPAHFAHVGEHPFLATYKRARAKRYAEQLMLIDGCRPPWPGYTLLAQGQGEVRELMSILRCRSFAGHFTICLKDLRGAESFARQAAEFWQSLDLM